MKCKACIFTCKTFREMAGCQGVFCIVRDAARKALNLPVCEQSSGCSLGNHYSGAFKDKYKRRCEYYPLMPSCLLAMQALMIA